MNLTYLSVSADHAANQSRLLDDFLTSRVLDGDCLSEKLLNCLFPPLSGPLGFIGAEMPYHCWFGPSSTVSNRTLI